MTGPIPLFSPNPSNSLQKPVLQQPSAPLKKLSLFERLSEEPADTALRSAQRRGSELAADSASRILQLQTQTGLPREVIANRLDEVEKAVASDAFDASAFRHANPVVAQWLSENPDNASLAQDDLGQLGKIEGYLTSLTRGTKRGVTMSAAGVIAQHQREQGGKLLPSDEIRLTVLERELAREPQGRNFVQDVLFYGGEFAGQMAAMTPEIATSGAAGVIAGAAIGSVAGPLSPITSPSAAAIGATVGSAYGAAKATFRLEGGLAYRELGKVRGPNGEELSENVKRYASIAIGTLNAGLEVWSLLIITAPFVQMGQKLLRRVGRDVLTKATMRGALVKTGAYYGKAMTGEVGTEVLQEINSVVMGDLAKIVTDANFKTIFNSAAEREQLVLRIAAVAEQTAKGMLLVGLPGASITLASNVAKARQAQRRVDFFTALGEDIANSKSFQRLPEATQEIIRRKTENTPIEAVYLDLAPLTEYFESKKLDTRQVIKELLGSTLEYDQAVANGTAIRIPMAIYATKLAPTEHNAFLVNEIRLGSEDAFNARIAIEAIKEAEELAKIEPDEMTVAIDRENLVNEFAEKLEHTGRLSAEAANPQAQQMADFFLTLEKRTGIDPRTLYELSIGDPETLESFIPTEAAGPSEILEQEVSPTKASPSPTTRAERKGNRFSAELRDSLKAWQQRNLAPPLTALDDIEGRKIDPTAAIIEFSNIDEQVEILRAEIEMEWLPGQLPNPKALEELAEFVLFLERNSTLPELADLHKRMRDIQYAVLGQQWMHAGKLWEAIPPFTQRWIRAMGRAASVWRWIEQGDAMTFYQRDRMKENPNELPKGFYSKAEALVDKEMGGKASRHQLTKLFEKIKAEEREWLGIAELLESQETFTKDEVLDYLRANRLNLQWITNTNDPSAGDIDEHALEAARDQAYDEVYEKELARINRRVSFDDATQLYTVFPFANVRVSNDTDKRFLTEQTFQTRLEVDQYLTEYLEDDAVSDWLDDKADQLIDPDEYLETGEPVYQKYTLIGGSNYREILLTLPDVRPQFEDGHFGEVDNVFAHARLKDRSLWSISEAERLRTPEHNSLFMEEVQSDWHQEGRDKGYTSPEQHQEIIAIADKVDQLVKELWQENQRLAAKLAAWDFTADAAGHGAWLDRLVDRAEIVGGFAEAIGREAAATRDLERLLADPISRNRDATLDGMPPALLTEVQDYVSKSLTRVDLSQQFRSLSKVLSGAPNAPFKKTWHEFVFKAMLTEATNKGKDAIAWTTGIQQVLRYPERFPLVTRAGISLISFDTPGEFVLYINDFMVPAYMGSSTVTAATLSKRLSPAIAEELLRRVEGASPGERVELPTVVTGSDKPVYLDEYSMVGFYDGILVDYANKLGKKYGSKVETATTTEPAVITDVVGGIGLRTDMQLPMSETAAVMHRAAREEVHVLKITEEMKQAIGERGFELFQRAYHGTPHPAKIKKFSTQKILTGEGTLNQGWGLYFTSSKKAGRWYRDALSEDRMTFTYKGKMLFNGVSWFSENDELIFEDTSSVRRSDLEIAAIAYDLVLRTRFDLLQEGEDDFDLDVDGADAGFEGPDKEDFFKNSDASNASFSELLMAMKQRKWPMDRLRVEAHNQIKSWRKMGVISKSRSEEIFKAIETFDVNRFEVEPSEGRTYEVEIPNDEELMRWDDPLNQQSAGVLEALSRSKVFTAVQPDSKRIWRGVPDEILASWASAAVVVRSNSPKEIQAKVIADVKLELKFRKQDIRAMVEDNMELRELGIPKWAIAQDKAVLQTEIQELEKELEIASNLDLSMISFKQVEIQMAWTGEQLYNKLAEYFNQHTPAHEFSAKELEYLDDAADIDQTGGWRMAAQHLAKLGIKGHLYKSGHDNKNYVIWDDKAIEIVNEFLQADQAKNAPRFTAAIRVDGKIYTGDIHEDAIEKYVIKTLGNSAQERAFEDALANFKGEQGFVDQTGRWYTWKEAYKAYNKAQQKSHPRPEGKLYAEDIDVEESDEFLQDEDAPPRAKITFQGSKINIQLFERANFSSFLHESGHVYLETMTRLVTEKGVTGQVADDLDIFRKAIGALPGATVYTTEQHEIFARLSEAYFREGRAPSSRLKEAFYRFGIWLKALYPTLDQLGVELTDEVRGAFDRMFATDAEIAAKESDAAIIPLFTDAAAAGMTETQFKVYKKSIEKGHQKAVEQLQAKVMRDEQKRRSAEHREAKKTITEEVTAEVNNMPIFRTLIALQKGEQPDGTPLDAPLKIDRQAIVDAKGEDFLIRLPLPYVYAKEGGVALQDAADLLGYDSGDALLEAIVDAPNRREVIASEVEQRLKKQFGDMKTDGELDQSAKDAVLNEHRDVIIIAEIRALKAKQRSVAKAIAQREREVMKEATKERAYERRFFEAEKNLAVAMAEGKAKAEIEKLQDTLADLEMEKDRALKDAEKERAYERRFLEAEAAKKQDEGLELLREGDEATLPSMKDIRQMAKDRIAQLTLREIHPHRYWVAARRASQAAVKAAVKDDYVTAVNAKQAELLSVAMHREAVKALERSQKLQRYAKSLLKPSTQERIGLAGATYLDQVNQMLERFDFRQVSAKDARGRKSLMDFVTTQQALGLPVNIPDDLLNEAFRMPWKDMTLEDLQLVTDALKHIVHLANTKNRLLAAGAKRSFDATVATAAGVIRNNAKSIRPRDIETRLPSGAAKRLYEGYFIVHRKFSNLIREMEGFKDNGFLWETFVLPLNQSMDRKMAITKAMTQSLHELFEKHYPGLALSGMYTKTVAKSLDDTSLTKMARLMMALNMGTEDNRTKLLNGLGKTLGREVSEAEVFDALDELTETDWMFVEDMWKFLDQFWKPMEELSKRLDGVAPEKIPAAPFMNRFGKTVSGGYMPIKYDDRQSGVAFKNIIAQRASKIMSASATRSSTKAGSRNARVENVQMPLRLDFSVIFEHLEEVALDLSHTEMLIDLTRLLNAPEIESAVRDHYGDQVYKMMLGTIRDVAAGDIPPQNLFDQGLNWIRHGSSIAALAWNFSTAMLQPFGITQSIVRLGGGIEGTKWVGRGLKRWMTDAVNMENTVTWIHQVSPFMAHRYSTFLREINEIENRVGVASSKMHVYLSFGIEKATLDKLDLEDLQRSFFWMISRAQLIADVPTWLGAYEKFTAQGIDEDRAVLLADQVVIDSQATGQMKDMAEIQRGNPALKLWTNFYTFFSAAVNLNMDAFKRMNFKSPVSIGRLAADMIILNVIPVILVKMLKDSLRGDEEDDWTKAMLAEIASYIANMFIGFRELSGIIQGFYNYGGTSGARVFAEAGKLIKQISQGEIDKALLKSLSSTAGILFHFPAAQVQRSVEGWIAFTEGKAGIQALIFGPPRRN